MLPLSLSLCAGPLDCQMATTTTQSALAVQTTTGVMVEQHQQRDPRQRPVGHEIPPSVCDAIWKMRHSMNAAPTAAVPHAMIDYIQWRRRSNRRGVDGIEVRTTELVGMVMVYDSQYTCDACVTRRNRSKAREPKNETAICTAAVAATTYVADRASAMVNIGAAHVCPDLLHTPRMYARTIIEHYARVLWA